MVFSGRNYYRLLTVKVTYTRWRIDRRKNQPVFVVDHVPLMETPGVAKDDRAALAAYCLSPLMAVFVNFMVIDACIVTHRERLWL